MRTFFRFENRWIITASLRMKTALSVGSRASLMPAGSDLPVIKTPEGIPFIPGSSLKGVVRSHIEQVLRTMEALSKRRNGERLWACDPLDEQARCVTAERKKSIMEQIGGDDQRFTERVWNESCTVCRLFGSQWLASRVSFQDAMLVNQNALLRLTEVRDGVGIDRDLGSAKPKIKYDFETVPQGASFGMRIIVENAEEWEVGLLVLALEAMGRSELPVGGKTTRGLGWGELDGLKIQCIGQNQLLDYLVGTVQPTEFSPQDLLRGFVATMQEGGERHA